LRANCPLYPRQQYVEHPRPKRKVFQESRVRDVLSWMFKHPLVVHPSYLGRDAARCFNRQLPLSIHALTPLPPGIVRRMETATYARWS